MPVIFWLQATPSNKNMQIIVVFTYVASNNISMHPKR